MKPYQIALQEYGTKSISGVFSNAKVLRYFKEIGQTWVKDDDTAWCAAFVNWCIKQSAGYGTGSLSARSFLSYGLKTTTPELGDIVVLWRISRESPYGHVGFYINETKDFINILGGNQSGEVNIKSFAKTQLLDYRKTPA